MGKKKKKKKVEEKLWKINSRDERKRSMIDKDEKRQCYGMIKAMKGMHKKSTDKVNKNRQIWR